MRLDVSQPMGQTGLNREWPPGTLLSMLSPDARAGLLRHARRNSYAPGQVLFLEGDPTDYAFVLLDGVVKRTVHCGGTYPPVLLDILGSGNIVGEIEAFDGPPRTATIEAATHVDAAIIVRRDLLATLERFPTAALAVTRAVARQLRRTERRRAALQGSAVYARLAHVLCDLIQDHGKRTDAGVVITLRLSQLELASLIGATEVSVNRELRWLRSRGILATGYRRITILDPAALANHARDAEPWLGPTRSL